MSAFGLKVKGGSGGKRVELQCEHQNGVAYVVPSEASWVCSEELLHVHALAGFLGQISELEAPGVKEAMQRWGIYYRRRPLEAGGEAKDEAG